MSEKVRKVQVNSSDLKPIRVQELIAATNETVKKLEPDVKVIEKQSDKLLKKTLLLDGLG